MFLSRIEFQPRRSGIDAVDLYRIHQMLWLAFPESVPGSRPFLFRADIEASEAKRPHLLCLVQSLVEADWSRLGEAVFLAEQKPYSLAFAPGQRLRFLLRANPTVSRKGARDPGFLELGPEEFRQKRGKRQGLRDEKEQRAWLERKAVAGGFDVGSDFLTTNRRSWKWSHQGNAASHDGVDFQGVLRVTDARLFASTVRDGIGAGKGLGFGLLSLAPAHAGLVKKMKLPEVWPVENDPHARG